MPQKPQPPPKFRIQGSDELREQRKYDLKVAQTKNAFDRQGDGNSILFLEQVLDVETSYTQLHFVFAKAKSELEWLGLEWKFHALYNISGQSEFARHAGMQITNLIKKYDNLLHAFHVLCRCLTDALHTYITNRKAIEEDHHRLVLQ